MELRIALVSQEYPPETAHGGIASQTAAKAHGLARRGHEVHVISVSASGDRVDFFEGPVHVTRLSAAHSAQTEPARWLIHSAAVRSELNALHSRSPLDLVDVPEYGSEGFVHLLDQSPWERVPTVVHLHGPLVMLAHTLGWPSLDSELYRVGTFTEGTCVRLADAVYSSSRTSVQWCAEHYGLDAGRVEIVHLGVDTAVFRPQPSLRDSTPTIVFAGRLAESKGVVTLAHAASALAPELPGLRLRLAGRGEAELVDRLRAIAAVGGLELDLLGPVSHDRLADVLASGHVFAAPSRYEGGPGLVYLEAMACGLPVVGCSGSGVTEVVNNGVEGILVAPDDPDELQAALREALGPGGAAMGRAGLGRARAEWDREVCLDRLEKIYFEVAARGVLAGAGTPR